MDKVLLKIHAGISPNKGSIIFQQTIVTKFQLEVVKWKLAICGRSHQPLHPYSACNPPSFIWALETGPVIELSRPTRWPVCCLQIVGLQRVRAQSRRDHCGPFGPSTRIYHCPPLKKKIFSQHWLIPVQLLNEIQWAPLASSNRYHSDLVSNSRICIDLNIVR